MHLVIIKVYLFGSFALFLLGSAYSYSLHQMKLYAVIREQPEVMSLFEAS